MKKEYFKPEIKLEELTKTDILCLSNPKKSVEGENNTLLNSVLEDLGLANF